MNKVGHKSSPQPNFLRISYAGSSLELEIRALTHLTVRKTIT